MAHAELREQPDSRKTHRARSAAKGARETRVSNKLTDAKVKAAKPGKKYGDGGGLWLIVRETGSAFWLYRFSLPGRKDQEMSLGSVVDVSLEQARDERDKCRKCVKRGEDPRIARHQQRQLVADGVTFREDGESYIADKLAGWTEGTQKRFKWLLKTYVYNFVLSNGRTFGEMPVNKITTDIVREVLRPIWDTLNPTAIAVRQIIESVLSYSKALKHRQGENPAAWRDNLVSILSRPSKVHRKQHHPAIHYSKTPAFLTDLRCSDAIAAWVLEFVMFCPVRINVAVNAKWDQFHPVETPSGVKFPGRRWDVPEFLMKGYRDIQYPDGIYPVPLFDPLEDVLQAMWEIRENEFVFPGRQPGTHICSDGVCNLAHRLTHDPVSTHGFRSTFIGWADSVAFAENIVKEMCLGHSVGSDTERAYRREDLLEKRRLLHEGWAEYLETGKPVPFILAERFMQRFKDQPTMMQMLMAA